MADEEVTTTATPRWVWPLIVALAGGGGVAAIGGAGGPTPASVESVQALEKLHDQRMDAIEKDLESIDGKLDEVLDEVRR